MTKHLSDDWMSERDFIEPQDSVADKREWWWNLRTSSLELNAPLTVHPDVSIQDTITLLDKEGFDQIPVVDESGDVAGMATLGNMMSLIMKGKATTSDPVSKAIYKQFKTVTLDT